MNVSILTKSYTYFLEPLLINFRIHSGMHRREIKSSNLCFYLFQHFTNQLTMKYGRIPAE